MNYFGSILIKGHNFFSFVISLVDSQWSSLHSGLIFIHYASFPRAQRTLSLVSTLSSLQGVLKARNCSGWRLNPCRSRWRVIFSWRFPLQSDCSCQGRLEAFWMIVILWTFSVSKMGWYKSSSAELLGHVSCVRLFATLWTAAHQAPPSMGFPRREHWSGLPLPPPDPALDSPF